METRGRKAIPSRQLRRKGLQEPKLWRVPLRNARGRRRVPGGPRGHQGPPGLGVGSPRGGAHGHTHWGQAPAPKAPAIPSSLSLAPCPALPLPSDSPRWIGERVSGRGCPGDPRPRDRGLPRHPRPRPREASEPPRGGSSGGRPAARPSSPRRPPARLPAPLFLLRLLIRVPRSAPAFKGGPSLLEYLGTEGIRSAVA